MADSDLTRFLSHWPRTTGEFQVRELQADDGRMLLQVRIDLGVIQMEAEGRPDGQRPHDFAFARDERMSGAERSWNHWVAAQRGCGSRADCLPFLLFLAG